MSLKSSQPRPPVSALPLISTGVVIVSIRNCRNKMDGLSIAASIIAVLQAANAVISICYDYSAALKDAPWQLSKITAETKTLRNVLETLENLAAKAKGGDPAAASRLPSLTQLCEPIVGALPMCLVELDALNKKLAPPGWAGPSGSKKAALTQALRWPLKERIRRRFFKTLSGSRKL